MKKIILFLLLFNNFLYSQNSPDGFKWIILEEINAKILSPNDWFFENYFISEKAYAITKEKNKDGIYEIGLLIFFESNIKKDIIKYVKDLTETDVVSSEENIFKKYEENDNYVQITTIDKGYSDPLKKILITKVVRIANIKKNILYTFIFTCPESN